MDRTMFTSVAATALAGCFLLLPALPIQADAGMGNNNGNGNTGSFNGNGNNRNGQGNGNRGDFQGNGPEFGSSDRPDQPPMAPEEMLLPHPRGDRVRPRPPGERTLEEILDNEFCRSMGTGC